MITINFWILVLIIAAIISLLSFVLMKIFKNSLLVRFIPTLLTWLISIILFIYAHFFASSTQDISYYILSMATGLATLVILIVTLIIDHIMQKKAGKKKIKHKEKE